MAKDLQISPFVNLLKSIWYLKNPSPNGGSTRLKVHPLTSSSTQIEPRHI